MKKGLLTLAAIAAFASVNAQNTYNYFDPKDCDAEGWLWFDTQEKIDKYVGFEAMDPANNPKIILQSATFENADQEYAEPFADPTLKGYNAEGVQGGEGSWTGAIALCGGSGSTGLTVDGGAILLYLPDCALFEMKVSTSLGKITAGLEGAKGHVPVVDCAVVHTYGTTIFSQPFANAYQYTWNNMQDLKNANTDLKFASPEGEPVTALIRNNVKTDLLVQAIRVRTYTQNYEGDTAVEGVEISDNAPAVYYNLQGVQVKGDQPGIYICRQGNKTSKVVVK